MAIPDNAVCALTKLLGHGVSFIDDEVLVEHLEHLTALEIAHDGYLCLNGLGRCWRERRWSSTMRGGTPKKGGAGKQLSIGTDKASQATHKRRDAECGTGWEGSSGRASFELRNDSLRRKGAEPGRSGR